MPEVATKVAAASHRMPSRLPGLWVTRLKEQWLCRYLSDTSSAVGAAKISTSMTQPIGYGEYVVSEVPFVVRRRVKWGDCDPAGMVYTVMFSEFVISTAELFYASLLGGPAYTVMTAMGCTTPTRALSFDFRHSLSVDDDFEITVRVADVRNSTY